MTQYQCEVCGTMHGFGKGECPAEPDEPVSSTVRHGPAEKPVTVILPRPAGSNADEWALFLEEFDNSPEYIAVQIAEAIDKAEADNARLTADLAAKDVALRKMLTITQGMIKGYISPYKLEEAEAAAQTALADHSGDKLLAALREKVLAACYLPAEAPEKGWPQEAVDAVASVKEQICAALAALPSAIPDSGEDGKSCPECGGQGCSDIAMADGAMQHTGREATCFYCDGTGRIAGEGG